VASAQTIHVQMKDMAAAAADYSCSINERNN